MAFEPIPEKLAISRRNVELNSFTNIIVRSEAVGDGDSPELMSLVNDPDLSTLAALEPTRKDRGSLPIQMLRIDRLVEADHTPPPDLIKIDIEGADVKAWPVQLRPLKRTELCC